MVRWHRLAFVPLICFTFVFAETAEQRAARHLESIRNSPPLLLDFLRDMPKGGDLHNHLAGAIYAESFISYAVKDNLCVDRTTGQVLPASMSVLRSNFVQTRCQLRLLRSRPLQLPDRRLVDAKFDASARLWTRPLLCDVRPVLSRRDQSHRRRNCGSCSSCCRRSPAVSRTDDHRRGYSVGRCRRQERMG